jgi:NDP-4-keto-2,6-dideoxyhexose 3-C-methyltransferase
MNSESKATKVMTCFLCGGKELESILSLGVQPMSGIFPAPTDPDPSMSPLGIEICNSYISGSDSMCGNVQLSHISNFDEMYGLTYGYNSSLSPQMLKHLNNIGNNVKKYLTLTDKDWVLDIGCNDGSLLKEFISQTQNLVGVDPSAAKFSDLIPSNVHLFVDYFPSKACEDFMDGKKFKLITSIAMFYDLPEPKKFIEKIYENLDIDGIWVVELAELNQFLKNLSYDQICHEHLLYLDNKQVVQMALSFGFTLIDLTYSEINGGSACYYFSKDKSKGISPNLNRVSKIQIKQLARRIEKNKSSVMDYLIKLKKLNHTIIGYGASTKGNVLANYFGLTQEVIAFISDINPYKKGRHAPGTRIPIISHEEMRLKNPDYLFVFIWHLRHEVLVHEYEYIQKGGKIIFPLPRLHVVDSSNYDLYLNTNLSDESFDIEITDLTT